MGYRMIIADDEEMLIRLIRKLGHFEELGIEVVDECRNGEQAYESILRHRPDFVLTDIQMPVMDGLEMINKVRQVEPEILFVLLSGYRYFEYAQNAIRLNVADYLLKPVDEAQLNHILERLCRLTDERRRRENDQDSFRRMRDSRKQEKQDAFFRLITSPNAQLDPVSLQPEELFKEYEIRLPYENIQLLYLDIHLAAMTDMAILSYSEKLDQNAAAVFDGKAIHYSWKYDFGFLVLLNFSTDNLKKVRSAISVFYYNCKELQEIYEEAGLNMGVSSIHPYPSQFSELVAESGTAIWGRLVLGGNQMIRYEQLHNLEGFPVCAVLPEARRKRLKDSIHYLRQEELAEVFSEVRKSMEQYRYAHPRDIRELYIQLTQEICAGIPAEKQEALKTRFGLAARRAKDCLDLIQKAFAVAEDFLCQQKKALEAKNRKPVELAMTYITQNYARDISLESTAEAIGLSSAYLSRVFKETVGSGFNEYITGLRLEESKRLLSGTNLSIREVACAVGYADEKYYSKLFKKQLGIKPTEYRKLYG